MNRFINDKKARIFIAGASGMVGSAIVRRLTATGYVNVLQPCSQELNLINQERTNEYFDKFKPEYVFLAAAKVGGIYANSTYPADFIYDNLMIASNTIQAAYRTGTKKLLFLGSSCIYPKLCSQPIKEEYLLNGYLESTNEAYAVAKIAGLKLCQYYREQYGCNFISVMPTNLYGPNDNYDLNSSHVLPALLRKFYEAKMAAAPTVEVWGSGTPRREFLHVDDLADACVFLMDNYESSIPINVGTGNDISIGELADLVARVAKFSGMVVFDKSKPDGTPRKLLDVSRLHKMGWKHSIPLEAGIKNTYREKYCCDK